MYRPKADAPPSLMCCFLAKESDLEVQGYSASCTAARVLLLKTIIQQRELLPLVIAQLSCCIWHQIERLPESLVVLVVVWVELQHVPADPVKMRSTTERSLPATTLNPSA